VAQHEHENSIVSVRTYALVWIILLIFTGITVAVARMHLGALSVLTALTIASIKALLVLMFFMHLKYERPIFRAMFMVAVITLTVFIGLTFFDVAFR
jgi:cytochrome c oxidase subunit 4